MNIRFIQQDGNTITYEIPEFIDSMILFDNSTDITNVFNNTFGVYVVTLYTPFDTYINFIDTDTMISKQNYYNKYNTIYLESTEFIRGIVRRNVEGYKYNVELRIDHDLNNYKNMCSLPESELCNTVVRYIHEFSMYKTQDESKKAEILQLDTEIRDLEYYVNNPTHVLNQTNEDVFTLKDTIYTLDQQLTLYNYISLFLRIVIICFLLYFIKPYFIRWWWYNKNL